MDKKKILLVSLGHLSCDINGGALPAILPFLRSAFDLSYQATGGLMFAYACLSSMIQPLFGLLSDRFSKPWFIPLGVLLAGCGLFGSTFFATVLVVFLSRLSAVRRHCPVTIFLVAGIFPLVPGAGIYWTAYYVVTDQLAKASDRGFQTLKIAVAIVLGILFVFEFPQKWFRWAERGTAAGN